MKPLVAPLPDTFDPEEAFRRLAPLSGCVWLDSALPHATLGRWHYLAAEPYAVLSAEPGEPDPLQRLTEALAALPTAVSRPGTPPFQGGAIGVLGYDLNRSLERLPTPRCSDLPTPALHFGLYDVVLAFDQVRREGWIFSQGWPETREPGRRRRAAERLQWMQATLAAEPPALTACNAPAVPRERLAPQFAVPMDSAGAEDVTSNFAPGALERTIERAIEHIRAGDIFQVNLAQRLLQSLSGNPADRYLRLRRRNPAPFAGYYDGGPFQALSASPERFLRVEAGRVETRPIKGTRPRFADPTEDQGSAAALAASEKDRAENMMIVDLLRNDLSRVCRPDSVAVPTLCGLETYQFVHHLTSVVVGELEPPHTPLDLVRAAFPGGSITGAPKVRAMEIIAELEPTARGLYCGALGYVSPDGWMDLNILIRTLTAAGGWLQIPVGGGITTLSDPRREVAETWQKAQGLLDRPSAPDATVTQAGM